MSPRRGAVAAIRMGAVSAAVGAAALLPFSGCEGGTTSTGGNPGIVLEFRREGKPAAFAGSLHLVAAASDPEFYYEPPDDGTTPPPRFGLADGYNGPATILVSGESTYLIPWELLKISLFPRERLPLPKAAAAARSLRDSALPDFNIIVRTSGGSSEALGGWVPALRQEPGGFRSAEGDSGRRFVIELEPGHRVAGSVDSSSGPPLALYVPGTPFYAMVHAGRFEFVDLPLGRFPLRWITAAGLVYAVRDSLIVGAGDPASATLSVPLRAGERLDSVALPEPYPTLAPPEALPPGQYTFSDSVVVSLRAASRTDIYYTLDGSTPSLDSRKYAEPLVLKSSTTVKAVAYARGYNPSPMSVNNYVLAPAHPVIAPGSGRFIDSVKVQITGPAGSRLRYTLDGSTPTDASLEYTGPFVLRASAVVQAIALVPGLGSSTVVSNQYVIESDSASAK